MSDPMATLSKHFNYKPMRELVRYLSTYSFGTQAVAIHGAQAENILSIGDAGIMIAGNIYVCDNDDELDISGDTEGTETGWATATIYTVGLARSNGPDTRRYVCIKAHTSSANDEPGDSADWGEYWKDSPNDAVNAVGVETQDHYDRYFLITAKSDGVLTVWLAGDEASVGTAVLKIPQYDPEFYCPVCIALLVNDTAAATHTFGDTDLTSDVTYYQVMGTVFPHPDNLDLR